MVKLETQLIKVMFGVKGTGS